MDYQEVNAATIDRWVADGWVWGKPSTPEQCRDAREGRWEVLLTPGRTVPREWFPASLAGLKILGLACGGGQQMPLFSLAGAECTVLDYSPAQLESERMVAEREGYDITIVRHDMTKPLPFADESFDLVFHPVSNSYVREVEPVFREAYRVLRPGGIFLAGLDTGINYIVDGDEERIVNSLPFDPLVNPEQMRQLAEADCGVQFSHTPEEQIGGQLRAGFVLTDLLDDTNGGGRLHELGIPTFALTRAIRPR